MLISQLRLRGDTIHCKHNCLLQTREGGVVEAEEQVEDRVVMSREEDLFSLIDSKSFTSSGDEGGSPYCVLVEEEVDVVEAPPQVQLTISEEEEEEESSTIFSPHFSDPLLCSINPPSTVISVRCVQHLYFRLPCPTYKKLHMRIIRQGETMMRRGWCWRRVATSCWRRMLRSPSWRRCKPQRWRSLFLFNFSLQFSLSFCRRCRRQSWMCWRLTQSNLCELTKYQLREAVTSSLGRR